ncbi:MAG: glutamate formiminotransferase [delta proteobacterium ML8_F1]|nr:MAG: glutamate formiminotransferase [delta proteobacterium ML8_F1]
MAYQQLIECVPNFSEGRDQEVIEAIVDHFRGKKGVKLLDYSNDEDHNRMVVSLVGEPAAIKEAVLKAVGTALDRIDMRNHQGQHPRMGAVDVIPLIPIKNISVEETIELSREWAQEIYDLYQLPSFLYEKSASAPHREDLSKLRKGQFEGMAEKILDEAYRPDFGSEIHPTGGIVAVGCRMPLIAFNVNLDTPYFEVANKIAHNVRNLSGGLKYVKAIGIVLRDRGISQVSMNLTDYTKTPLYRAIELIRVEARRYGVTVVGSEIVGLVPMDALIHSAEYYMGLEDFCVDQVLEKRLME